MRCARCQVRNAKCHVGCRIFGPSVAERSQPVLEYFEPKRLLLASECGFQHVPLEITRGKMRALVAGAQHLRASRAAGFSKDQRSSTPGEFIVRKQKVGP